MAPTFDLLSCRPVVSTRKKERETYESLIVNCAMRKQSQT